MGQPRNAAAEPCPAWCTGQSDGHDLYTENTKCRISRLKIQGSLYLLLSIFLRIWEEVIFYLNKSRPVEKAENFQ